MVVSKRCYDLIGEIEAVFKDPAGDYTIPAGDFNVVIDVLFKAYKRGLEDGSSEQGTG